jgi:5'-nucleotidase / UDP-sugar diphosphatase
MRMFAKTLMATLLASAIFVPAAHAEMVNITFLLTSDIYNFDADKSGRGGFARLNAVVKAERAKGGHVIYAHAGDMISPSLLSGIDKGANTVALLNLAAPDFFVPGNHEFDFGPDVFRARMKEMKAQLLAANLRLADGKTAEGFSDGKIVDIGGVKVGVLGITADDAAVVASPGPGYTFQPSVETAQAAAKDLRKQGAELVVGIVQTDRVQDYALLDSHVFDLLLSGDDHHLNIHYDGRTALAESMTEAAYVTAVDLAVDVQENDGKRSLTWWPNFRVIDSATVTPDAETQAEVDKYNAQLSKELDVVVGTSSTPLDSRKASVRTGETAIGNLIADASRQSVGADVAITNGGGIRGNKEYPAGAKLTRKDIFTELPFGNKSVKLEVTGETVWAALENGFSEIENGAGRFPQVSGLVVEADFTQPKGSRVLSVTIGGKPLDKAVAYTLATNDYMQGGGDGYRMFTSAKVLVDALNGKLLASEVMDYIAAKKDVAPAIEGRIKAKM